jgi:hypothetical protein
MGQPAEETSSVTPTLPLPTPPRAPQLQAPIEQARSASDPATGELLVRVWANFEGYLSSIPNFFADEHVVSSVTTAYSSPAKNSIRVSDTASTLDTTIDSIFRLKRFSADGKTADLIESREIKAVDHQPASKDQRLIGPAILTGAFSYAPNVLAPQFKECYDYRLLSKRHNPEVAVLFLHADVLVLEYALRSPLPAGVQCPVREQTRGRAFIDPASMQIVRLEQQRPRHEEGSGPTVTWSWSIDYARVMLDGNRYWLPKTISSKASSLDGGRFKWSFLATYGNYHLMTVTSTILPAADSSHH